MPNTWIKETEDLFDSLEIEARAAGYVADHRDELLEQLDGNIVLLSRSNQPKDPNKALVLSEQDRRCYALCLLATGIGKRILQDNDTAAEKAAQLTVLTKKYSDNALGAILASLKSDALHLLLTTERALGRLNMVSGMPNTSASYDALLTRLTCEALHPKFMQALYDAFLPGTTILTLEEQQHQVKQCLRDYLISNDFSNFGRISSECVDLMSLIGEESLLSLFDETEADQDIRDGILALVNKLPVVQELKTNPRLAIADSAPAIMGAMEVFSVLSHYPHSMTNKGNREDPEDFEDSENSVVSDDSQNSETLSSKRAAIRQPETSLTPRTKCKIEGLEPEHYQFYLQICTSIKKTLTSFYALVPRDFSSSISIQRFFDQFTAKTFNQVFALFFNGMYELRELPEEITKSLLKSISELLTFFPGILERSSDNIRNYLDALHVLAELFPIKVLSSLALLTPSSKSMAIDSISTSINEEYHALIVDSLKNGLNSAQNKTIYQPFKELLVRSLVALPANQLTLGLLKQCLDSGDAIGKLLSQYGSRIKQKIVAVETTLSEESARLNASNRTIESPRVSPVTAIRGPLASQTSRFPVTNTGLNIEQRVALISLTF